MKKLLLLAGVGFFLVCGLGAGVVQAEDKVLKFPSEHALKSKVAQEMLLKDIRVYMKGQGHPGVGKRFREYSSNKRSNSVGKSDQEACDVAFISALIALQQRADREGGNGVVDIYSTVKNQKHQASNSYSCLSGRAMANVILHGTVVRF